MSQKVGLQLTFGESVCCRCTAVMRCHSAETEKEIQEIREENWQAEEQHFIHHPIAIESVRLLIKRESNKPIEIFLNELCDIGTSSCEI